MVLVLFIWDKIVIFHDATQEGKKRNKKNEYSTLRLILR